MKIHILNVYSDETRTFSGEPEQVREQLNSTYNFLKRYNNQSLQEDLIKLSQQQALIVNVEQQ